MAATETQVRALTTAYGTTARRRATLVALLAIAYYRTRVNAEDPASVQRWLDLMVPRIIAERERVSTLAATYGDTLRALEVPNVKDGYRFAKAELVDENKIRTSLAVVGPGQEAKAIRIIRSEPGPERTLTMPDVSMRQALMEEEHRKAETRITGAVLRHVQDGGRQTLYEGTKADKVALGWVRVTDAEPCYFCAMLASRGLVGGAYSEDSFDESNARFTGQGKVKVHDHCSCGLKPVYNKNSDPFLVDAKRFEAMWKEYSSGSGAAAIKSFRQGYEGRAVA